MRTGRKGSQNRCTSLTTTQHHFYQKLATESQQHGHWSEPWFLGAFCSSERGSVLHTEREVQAAALPPLQRLERHFICYKELCSSRPWPMFRVNTYLPGALTAGCLGEIQQPQESG